MRAVQYARAARKRRPADYMRARLLLAAALAARAAAAEVAVDFDARQVSVDRWRCTSAHLDAPDFTLDDLARCQAAAFRCMRAARLSLPPPARLGVV